MNMLHDVFPYASRYEEEVVDDDDAPNVNEAVDMSDYEKYSRGFSNKPRHQCMTTVQFQF